MKLFWTLVASLALPTLALSAKTPKDQYPTFRTKARSTPNIKLDDSSFDKITATPRNHTTAILLTALDARVGCKLCQDFQPEWQTLANSWVRGDPNDQSKVLFGTLDFADGRQTFQRLQLQTAPVLMIFPPTTGPNVFENGQTSPVRFDFTTGSYAAEQVHSWIARHVPSGPHPPVRRPFNWGKLITLTTIIVGGLTAAFVAYPYVGFILHNRNLWAGLSVIAVLLFTSGHMFNHIRATPYIAGDGKGGIQYFTGGFQNQLGLESQIVAAIYGVLAFSAISLGLKVPRIADARTQQIYVFIWSAVMFGGYSFLLSVFRIKNGGYPFWLPPF